MSHGTLINVFVKSRYIMTETFLQYAKEVTDQNKWNKSSLAKPLLDKSMITSLHCFQYAYQLILYDFF